MIETLRSHAPWLLATFEFLRAHPLLVLGGSLAMFIGTLVVMPWIIVRMSADYFVSPDPGAESWRRQHPVIRVVLRVLKNVLGVVFLVAGVAQLVLPGQGLLTILIALTLLDFPGKRRLELWFVTRHSIRNAVNWIRTRAGRPPLILPDSSS